MVFDEFAYSPKGFDPFSYNPSGGSYGGGMLESLLPLLGAAIPGLVGAGGGKTNVNVSTEQAVSQALGVSFNPIITVSSPGASASPDVGNVPTTGSPISQSNPVNQSNPDTPQSLLPSLSLPSGNAAGVTSSSVASPGSSFLDSLNSPWVLALIGLAAYLYLSGGK